jgi:RNA polymerase-binding transcription factor DksA
LHENLQEQRLFRQEQLRQIDAAPAARANRPPGPRATGQDEVRDALAASARMVLSDVEAALERMREGRYGICPLCRAAIARNRLVIVPQARYCGRCRQVGEAEG